MNGEPRDQKRLRGRFPWMGLSIAADPACLIGGDDAGPRPALAGPSARLAEDQGPISVICWISNGLLPLGSFGPFSTCFVVWQYQINVVYAQCARKFKEGHYRWIPAALLQTTDVLLGEAGGFGKTLLGEAFFPPYPPEISADQLAHVHPRKLRLYIL